MQYLFGISRHRRACGGLVTKSCLTLVVRLCSPPGSSVHGIFQARILEWIAISFSRGSSRPRDRTQVSCIAGRFLTNWAMREAHRRAYVWFKKQNKNKQVLNHVQLFATLWTVACQSPLSMGFFQGRILEWVAISSSRGSSPPTDWTHIFCIGRWVLYHWAAWEAPICVIDEGKTAYLPMWV